MEKACNICKYLQRRHGMLPGAVWNLAICEYAKMNGKRIMKTDPIIGKHDEWENKNIEVTVANNKNYNCIYWEKKPWYKRKVIKKGERIHYSKLWEQYEIEEPESGVPKEFIMAIVIIVPIFLIVAVL
jgi:hypothetical protein